MIKSYKLFLESKESNPPLSEVAAICTKYDINNWSINPDTGLVDVVSNVNLTFNMGRSRLSKPPLHFGKIIGNFYCARNNLTSFEGFPKEIVGDFGCQHNELTSLEGFPKVGGSIYLNNNKLTSLKGCPKKVNANFICHSNKLTTLKGCPQDVMNSFNCDNNKLVSLDGLGSFYHFYADNNTVNELTLIGRTMLSNKIPFLESVILNINSLSDKDFELIFQDISAQKILDLNDFKIFNLLRTNLPEKYKEVCALRNVDLSADLGELGF